MVSIAAILSLLLIIMGMITLYLTFWSFTKKRFSGAMDFSLFFLCVSIYTFGYALEISFSDLESILLAVKFEYIGIPFISYFAVLFSYHFSTGRPLNRGVKNVLLIIPVISTLLVLTIEHHNLFYINAKVVDGGLFPLLSFTQGPFYIIRYMYQLLISLASIVFLFTQLSIIDKSRKPQIIALITAQIFPIFIAILYFMRIIPYGLDLNPFSAIIVGSIFSIAILKFGLFEIIPQGRVLALDSIKEAFILLDRFTLVQDVNKAALDLGFIKLEVGKSIPLQNEFYRLFKDTVDNNQNSFDYMYEAKEGKSYYYKVDIYELKSSINREQGTCIILHDFTEARTLMDKLRFKATYDYLTKLNNRRSIISWAEREVNIAKRYNNPITFIMIDVDHFKVLNDTYGHQAGDRMLIAIADNLKAGLRNIDLIGRYGGEEFLVVCPDTNKEDGLKTAEHLRERILTIKLFYEQFQLTTTCSFGVYTFYNDNFDSLDKLIDKADKALYEAKNSGRNKVCYISDEN